MGLEKRGIHPPIWPFIGRFLYLCLFAWLLPALISASLKLLTCPERFPDPERRRAWVLRVTINCCKDLKKSAWARKRVSLEAAADAAVTMPEAGESPVLEAVLALPEKYRQAVYLRYYEEYGVDEIAALLGCRPAQVSTWLYRGKAKLRTMLGGSYGQECFSD
ncbi:RNA polymerase sigma factor [uncultured Oscillibacter sp.]|uniref:RNA polymerase sigma factor n=1 Tax=uncultured Oscillibacter sp. TaxID=876091 RepID=UPI00260EEEFD|nr:sigma-70 family RNA polymerase sigma factor [uncultured Oscillibacter sp.]